MLIFPNSQRNCSSFILVMFLYWTTMGKDWHIY